MVQLRSVISQIYRRHDEIPNIIPLSLPTHNTQNNTSVMPSGCVAKMIPSPDSVRYSISPPAKTSVSVRQPSRFGNSDEVMKTLEPSGQEPVGVGLGAVTGGGAVTGVGVVSEVRLPMPPSSSSHPQSTPKVVDVPRSTEPSENVPAAVKVVIGEFSTGRQ